MCRLSWNLGASVSWNPQGLSRPVMGLLYLYLYLTHIILKSVQTIFFNSVPTRRENLSQIQVQSLLILKNFRNTLWGQMQSVNMSDQYTGCSKISVHLIITIHSSGAQRLFDHPVSSNICTLWHTTYDWHTIYDIYELLHVSAPSCQSEGIIITKVS